MVWGGVLVPTITSTSAVVTWSGGLSQNGSIVTTTYTLNGSNTTPSSSGIGTATFTGLTINTVYSFVVTASTAAGSRTGGGTINTTIVSNQLYYNFPFQNDLLDYHTGSGVSVGTLTYPAEIYWQSTGGYNSGGCLYCSVNLPDRRFVFPNTSFYQTMGFSVSFWYKGIKGYSDAVFCVGGGYNRFYITYNQAHNCMFFDGGGNSGDVNYTINENQWYHICWVVQPNTATSYFYFNGGSVNGGQTVSVGTLTANNISNGGCAAFDDNTGTEQAKGYMNNLNIFNYAITQAQITALWQA